MNQKQKGFNVLPGANQYLSEYMERFFSSYGHFKTITQKKYRVEMDQRSHESVPKFETNITERPCLAHYKSNYPNIITTDASTKGFGATLCQGGTRRKAEIDRIC